MFAALISVALDLALNKFLEIFGRPALGRNQNGAELLQAPERRNHSAPFLFASGIL